MSTNPNEITLKQIIKKHGLQNACVQDLLRLLHQEKQRTFQLKKENQKSPAATTQKIIRHTTKKEGYIGRYKYLSVLGKGGVGTVYKVLDEELNRKVAMKVLHPHLLKDEVACIRFREEGQIAAQMQHPNVIPIYEMKRNYKHSYTTPM